MDGMTWMRRRGPASPVSTAARMAIFWVACAASFSGVCLGQAPQAPSANSGLRTMQQVEDRWSDAVGKRDQYAMELVLAPEYIGVSATGAVTTRNQEISALFVKGAVPDSLEQKAVSVRFVGGVLAIVNGTYVMRWREVKGPVDEKGVFSQVFELTRGGWICLNSQRTVVAVDSPDSKKEAAKVKPRSTTSNAPLPLHIPLIYKGPASTQPPPQPGSDQPEQ